MEVVDIIIATLGGEAFTAIAKVTPYKFTPEVLSFLSRPCYGIRAEFKGGKVVLVIYDRLEDLYIINVGKGCKNPAKVYTDIYYDHLLSIIERETEIEMPKVEYPEEDFIITDFE